MDTNVNEKKALSVISLLLGISAIILGTVSGIFSFPISLFFPILGPIVCCCVPFLLGAAGVALGIIGIRKEHQKIAVFGLILSIIGLIVIIGFVVVCCLIPVVAGLGAVSLGILGSIPVLESMESLAEIPYYY